MNKLIIILTFSIIILNSCNSDNKQIDNKVSNNISKTDTIISEGDYGKISGFWLSKKYYNDILKYKNPKKSQEISTLSFVKINGKDRTALIAWNFHEGITENIDWKNGFLYINGSKITLFDNELLYEEDTLIKFEINNDKNILNNLIFKGIYLNHNDTVRFYENGRIEGLDSVNYYTPMIDYMDAGRQVNQISLKENMNEIDFKDNETFGFQFSGDTLFIYNLNCKQFEQDRCVVVEFGELKYKLIKRMPNNVQNQ